MIIQLKDNNKFLEIKDKFLSYVINVNARDYEFGITTRFYNKIPRENVEDYYSEEYGFSIDNDGPCFSSRGVYIWFIRMR